MNKLDKVTLDNGLRIYLYPDHRRHSTFFEFITLFGGLTKDFRYKEKDYHMQDGVAHILEHYVVECNGCGNFLDKLGKRQMYTNASTGNLMTSYYFEAVNQVEYGIETMLKGIYSVEFSEKKLEKLKNPIYQEIRSRLSSKFYHAGIKSFNNLFQNLSFRNVGGTLEEVEKTTVEDIETCYKAFYQPKNQIIVIAGNFDKDKVLNIIQKFYKTIKFSKDKTTLLPVHEPKEVNKKEDVLYFPTALDYVDISFKVDVSSYSPKEQMDLDFYLHSFYHHFFGVVSPLYQKFVDEKVISNTMNAGNIMIYPYIIIRIGAYTHDPDKFIKGVFETIQNRKEFDKELFELDKKDAMIRMILRDENIMKMIMPFIDNVVYYHYPYLDEVEDVQRLNYDDYQRMIQELDFSNYTITTIKDKKE